MPDNPLDTTGRTVIVTGATMGLGRVIATRFLEHGGGEVPSYLLATTGEVAEHRPGSRP